MGLRDLFVTAASAFYLVSSQDVISAVFYVSLVILSPYNMFWTDNFVAMIKGVCRSSRGADLQIQKLHIPPSCKYVLLNFVYAVDQAFLAIKNY